MADRPITRRVTLETTINFNDGQTQEGLVLIDCINRTIRVDIVGTGRKGKLEPFASTSRAAQYCRI